MSRNLIIAIILMVIGLIAGLNLQQPKSELIVSPLDKQNGATLLNLVETNKNLQNRLDAIEKQQSIEKIARQSLLDSIESLKNEIHQNIAANSLTPKQPASGTTEINLPTTLGMTNQGMTNQATTNQGMTEFDTSKTQALAALGIDETITSRIQKREEKMEMDRLYLRNAAMREGWFGTEKYFEKTQGLSRTTNIYREELGDENYDYYLFDSNQSNRISVLSVISSSPAETAGLEKGDIISQYDHEAIFSWSDLTKATTDGEPGQQVSIVIQRNEEEIELFVPRGPLGIRLENIKVNPRS